MKKIVKGLVAAAVAVACLGVCAFAACGGDDNPDTPSTKTYTVTFDLNYTGSSTYATQTVDEGGKATRPATDPTRDGYDFDNWYTTSSCTTAVDFDSAINADTTYYAGWTEEAVVKAEYTVTFVISEGNTETVTVTEGEAVAAIEDPTSDDGSIFSGWYADESCETSFDFSAGITANTTVYAGWITIPEGYVAITYDYNYEGGGIEVKTAEAEDRVYDVPSVSRTGYRFMGWNTQADGTGSSFGYGSYVDSNITVYAVWYYGYVLEAEYTDLTDEYGMGRVFYGYSNNYSGAQAILADSSCSNGKYVQAGSQADKYLIFEVTCSEAVTDAYLTITAAMDYGYSIADANTHDGDEIGSVSISSSQYAITVFSADDLDDDEDPAAYDGATPLSYDSLVFNVSSLTTINTHCSFTTFVIGNISLSAGTNYIKLLTTSEATLKSAGGQMAAKSPDVDCITIYTGATLEQTIYQS